ncbi:hypothetical protein HMI55_003141, partial [Coelomomyces lativittatus]
MHFFLFVWLLSLGCLFPHPSLLQVLSPTTPRPSASFPARKKYRRTHRVVSAIPVSTVATIYPSSSGLPIQAGTIGDGSIKNEILQIHKDIRAYFGVNTPFVYDPALSAIARQAAENSARTCTFQHLSGDNLYQQTGTLQNVNEIILNGVKHWKNEVQLLGKYYQQVFHQPWESATLAQRIDALKYFYPIDKFRLGHLHQMVWKNSQQIGCAYAHNPSCKAVYVACK